MAVVLSPRPLTPVKEGAHAIGDLWLVIGSLRFSGRYVTGGEVMSGMPTFPGLGTVLSTIITEPRGFSVEYVSSTGRLQVFSSARTEHEEATYDTAISEDTNITAVFILV